MRHHRCRGPSGADSIPLGDPVSRWRMGSTGDWNLCPPQPVCDPIGTDAVREKQQFSREATGAARGLLTQDGFGPCRAVRWTSESPPTSGDRMRPGPHGFPDRTSSNPRGFVEQPELRDRTAGSIPPWPTRGPVVAPCTDRTSRRAVSSSPDAKAAPGPTPDGSGRNF